MNIQLAKPDLCQKEYLGVKNILESGWLGMGAAVKDFEKEISSYLGCKYCLAVNTGTSALHLALEAIEVKHKEIIVPSITYAATVQAILSAGGIPVFAECNTQNLNLDIGDVYKKISGKTKAILPVHYAGMPVAMDEFLELADRKKLAIIQDAAHAFGSIYKNKKIGTWPHITCFSFDPIKTITCGEGGCICTTDPQLAERITHMRVLGISKNTWDRYKSKRPWVYEVMDKGFRYHMSNINASIGLEQLKKIDEFVNKRRRIARIYNENFSGIKNVILLEHVLKEMAPFCYTIRVLDNLRDEFMKYMEIKHIGTSILYYPNHLQPFFKKYYTKLPVTERLSEEYVSLPLYSSMTDDELQYVTENVIKFFKMQ